MPEGDAPLSPVVSVLRDLGSEAATGCLALRRPDGLVSHLYLADGRLYAADAPGERPTLGTRLVTHGVVSSLDVFQALDRQWAESAQRQLGEVLVDLERAEAEAVAPHVRALLVDTVADALAQEAEAWQVREGAEARGDVGEPVAMDDLLDELAGRAAAWEELSALLGGPLVTVLLVEPPARTDDLDPGELAVLDRLAPHSTLPAIALDTGLTLLEVGRHVRRLAEDGVVTVADTPPQPAVAETAAAGPGLDPDTVLDAPTGTAARRAEPADHEVAEYRAAPGLAVPRVAPDADSADEAEDEPAEDETEPATDEVEPTTDEEEPVTDETEPTTDDAEQTTDEEEPVTDDAQLVTDEAQPVTDDAEPTADETEPTTDEVEPVTDEGKPVTDGTEPDESPETETLDTAALLRELASLGADVPAGDDALRGGEKATGRSGRGRG